MKMREFTKSDWAGWAGAERPEDGEPLIGEFLASPPSAKEEKEITVIVDNTGITFYADWENFGRILVLEYFCTYKLGKVIAEGLNSAGPIEYLEQVFKQNFISL